MLDCHGVRPADGARDGACNRTASGSTARTSGGSGDFGYYARIMILISAKFFYDSMPATWAPRCCGGAAGRFLRAHNRPGEAGGRAASRASHGDAQTLRLAPSYTARHSAQDVAGSCVRLVRHSVRCDRA